MFKTKWSLPKEPIPGLEPWRAVLAARGLTSEAEQAKFIAPNYQEDMGDPLLFADMEAACARIKTAVEKKETICIYGDYDIDGITATTLLCDFLSQIGAKVESYIPDRYEEGYGINSGALDTIKQSGAKLVITVDCGVTAVKEAKHAKKIGLDLIITDHHEPPAELPTGQIALLNPKLAGCKYPFLELAGVGVAFTLIRGYMKLYPDCIEKGQEKWLLDLVALGTVCDVVPLVGENRVLAYYGLKVLQKTRRVGLIALMEASSVKQAAVSASDLGFRLGPRLNAAGRLEHARAALNLLQASERPEAIELADRLNVLNSERQEQTSAIFREADMLAKKDRQNLILVLASPDWLHGVVGIVASRISEKYHKPTILLQIEGDTAKGSARSFGNFSIIEAIGSCADNLEKFGGHDFAAGMTLKTENIELFRYKINEFARRELDVESLVANINIDAILESEAFDLATVADLLKLQPFGRDNPEPLFAAPLRLAGVRPIGADLTHQKFTFSTESGRQVGGIAFSSVHKWPNIEAGANYNVAFRLQENIYNDISSLQLEVVDILPLVAE